MEDSQVGEEAIACFEGEKSRARAGHWTYARRWTDSFNMTGDEWELADSAAENFGRSNARAKRQRAVAGRSVRVSQATPGRSTIGWHVPRQLYRY